MTDYKDLTEMQKAVVDSNIVANFEDKIVENTYTGFRWNERALMLEDVHRGHYCATCFMVYYNCLCSHDS